MLHETRWRRWSFPICEMQQWVDGGDDFYRNSPETTTLKIGSSCFRCSAAFTTKKKSLFQGFFGVLRGYFGIFYLTPSVLVTSDSLFSDYLMLLVPKEHIGCWLYVLKIFYCVIKKFGDPVEIFKKYACCAIAIKILRCLKNFRGGG